LKAKKRCEITDRDYKLLRFLWKWKIVSTQGLAKKFYPEADPYTAYRRLLYLESDGYIGHYPVGRRFNDAWIIKEKGFNYILPYLGDLKSKGYKSTNYPHDFLATAFHLGEWLIHQPTNSQTYSEQQLRCYPEDLWPSWVPTSSLHRPDGYSAYQSADKQIIIAFEAELSLKAKKRYESIVAFYDGQPSINCVFWLVDSKLTLNAIRRTFQKFQVREWSKHHFVLLSDFKQKGWMASFIEGNLIGRSPANLLMHKTSTILTQNPLDCVTLSLLDSRRRPIISKS
jgi:hypothetical protein